MLKIKVENMLSSRGNTIPNQFIIKTDLGSYFQSYETVIALEDSDKGITILDINALNYSRTTSKYLYQFLGMKKDEILLKIREGKIILKDLNTK